MVFTAQRAQRIAAPMTSVSSSVRQGTLAKTFLLATYKVSCYQQPELFIYRALGCFIFGVGEGGHDHSKFMATRPFKSFVVGYRCCRLTNFCINHLCHATSKRSSTSRQSTNTRRHNGFRHAEVLCCCSRFLQFLRHLFFITLSLVCQISKELMSTIIM